MDEFGKGKDAFKAELAERYAKPEDAEKSLQDCIGADFDTASDYRGMFVLPVVITGDRASPDIRVFADRGVTQISKVHRLRAATDP